MTPEQVRKTRSIVKALRRAQMYADEINCTLVNGGEVGGLAGTMADELEEKLRVIAQQDAACPSRKRRHCHGE